MTNNSAETMAGRSISEEVALAMVPVCLKQQASGVGHRDALMEAGSATRPSSNTPDRDLADACLAGLELNGS